jgi:hypothetical protein
MQPIDYLNTHYDCVLGLGSIVVFTRPELTTIRRDEIKLHISNMCRYNGAVGVKLLDHECLVASLAGQFPQFRISYLAGFDPVLDDLVIQKGYGAIHDDPEVYLGDVVTGLKRLLGDYKQLERIWEPYVHAQLGMPLQYRNDEFVKALDTAALVLEMRAMKHPLGLCAPEKYKAIYHPLMDKYAEHILFELSPNEKWDIIERSYLAGRTKLQERLDEREDKT